MDGDLVLALTDREKLAALQEVDLHRPWQSLDDRRRCLQCGKPITGRQIQLFVSADGSGLLRGRCPSEGCLSIPMDWALPRDAYSSLRKIEEMESALPVLGGPSGGVAER